jgi:hypothetical protein
MIRKYGIAVAGILILASIALASDCHAQISPATRPHTHSGGSSGGSTLSPATLNVSGSINVSGTGSGVLFGGTTTLNATSYYSMMIDSGGTPKQFIGGADPSSGGSVFVGSLSNHPVNFRANNTNWLKLDVDGTLSSVKACATNYTRVSANFCKANPFAVQTWTNLVACTDRTLTNAIPAGATRVLLRLDWSAISNNAIGFRTNFVSFSNLPAASGCAAGAQGNFSNFSAQEFVATVAGTTFAQSSVNVAVPLTNTNTFTAAQGNAGGNGNASIGNYAAVGYFD